jgi:hypothetical protein
MHDLACSATGLAAFHSIAHARSNIHDSPQWFIFRVKFILTNPILTHVSPEEEIRGE